MYLASSLQQRFQGLILGLAMVPLLQKGTHSLQSQADSLDQAIVQLELAQLDRFLQGPDTYLAAPLTQPLQFDYPSNLSVEERLLLSALPLLVRHHSNREMRQRWLKIVLSPQHLSTYPSLLYFGDVLAASLRGPDSQGLFQEIPTQTMQIHPAVEMAAHQLTKLPTDYRVAVRLARSQSAIAASLVGGLLGAAGGRGFLPMLWQLPTAPLARPLSSLLNLANSLFNLWGGLPITCQVYPALGTDLS